MTTVGHATCQAQELDHRFNISQYAQEIDGQYNISGQLVEAAEAARQLDGKLEISARATAAMEALLESDLAKVSLDPSHPTEPFSQPAY